MYHLLISFFFAHSPSCLPPPSSSPSSSVLVPPLCLASSRAPLHGRRLVGGAVGALLGALRGERHQRAPPRLDSGPAGPAGSRRSPLSGTGPADLWSVPGHLPPGGHPALHRAQEKAMPRAALPGRGPGAGQAPLALPRPGPHPVSCFGLSAQPEARGSGRPGHAGR